jgi:hypothetical protein
MDFHFPDVYDPADDVFDASSIGEVLRALTGQECTFSEATLKRADQVPPSVDPLTRSQLNSLLLWHGYDRIREGFFELFFACGTKAPQVSWPQFLAGVHNFRMAALLRWGNVKFGFKTWAGASRSEIEQHLLSFGRRCPAFYGGRGRELVPVEPASIPIHRRWQLGYLTSGAEESEIEETRAAGTRNSARYLTYEHMDVYVATSMRDPDDFWHVASVVKRLHADVQLQDLGLRVYDPTLSYERGRAAKGLQEALMLLRCRCCVYCIQHSDSIGKDSELASVLAQGKPVIVYAPGKDDLRREFAELPGLCAESGRSQNEVMDAKLKRLLPPEQLAELSTEEEKAAKAFIAELDRYEHRVKVLKEGHPLALQVGIYTGVANGVLVARSTAECAALIRQIMLRETRFRIGPVPDEPCGTIGLYEQVTNSLFRISTGDELLTNTFWNFHKEDLARPSGRHPLAAVDW